MEKGTWFLQWSVEFNSYTVQNISDGENNGKSLNIKQGLDTFVMNVHPKVPIIHINEDTLDNRKSNLAIYDRDKANDFEELDDESTAIILRDKYGKEKARALIDSKDLNRVINSGYTWVYYKNHSKAFAVANSPEGRIYLNRFIMSPDDEAIVNHINHNTLDNKESNLVIKVYEKDESED